VSAQNIVTQCRNVLLMVHELHLYGYQRVRAIPEMAASGKYWRCVIAPASVVAVDHGARLVGEGRANGEIRAQTATYTSLDGNRYFAWEDIYPYADPRELATIFLERFPEVAEAGRGPDWAYAGWYMEMLLLTHPDQFPFATADDETPETFLRTASPKRDRRNVRIPLPPAGEAFEDGAPPSKLGFLHRSPRRVSGNVGSQQVAV
jgi:hypothetical protein